MHTIYYKDNYSIGWVELITVARYNGGAWQAELKNAMTNHQWVGRKGEITMNMSLFIYGSDAHGHRYY